VFLADNFAWSREGRMISGTLSANLRAAIQSAQRLQGHAVHVDTVAYWRALLTEARQALRDGDAGELEDLVITLETLLTER
jgi:hypothetical protein